MYITLSKSFENKDFLVYGRFLSTLLIRAPSELYDFYTTTQCAGKYAGDVFFTARRGEGGGIKIYLI